MNWQELANRFKRRPWLVRVAKMAGCFNAYSQAELLFQAFSTKPFPWKKIKGRFGHEKR